MLPKRSVLSGIGSQVLLALACEAFLPIAAEISDSLGFFKRANYTIGTIAFQTVGFPALFSFAFLVVVIMLWHRSLLIRFLISLAGSLIAFTCFAVLMAKINGEDVIALARDCAMPLSVYFFVASAMAVCVQLFAPWTLVEAGTDQTGLKKTGTASLMQLSVIAAVAFAVMVRLDFGENVIGALTFGGMSALASLVALTTIQLRLTESPSTRWKLILPMSLAFGFAVCVNGVMAMFESGGSLSFGDALAILALSIYGACLLMGLSLLQTQLLKVCGWKLVRRGCRLKVE